MKTKVDIFILLRNEASAEMKIQFIEQVKNDSFNNIEIEEFEDIDDTISNLESVKLPILQNAYNSLFDDFEEDISDHEDDQEADIDC